MGHCIRSRHTIAQLLFRRFLCNAPPSVRYQSQPKRAVPLRVGAMTKFDVWKFEVSSDCFP